MGNSFVAGAQIYKENDAGNFIPPKPDDKNLYWAVEKADSDGVLWVCREVIKQPPYRTETEYETLRKQYSNAMIAAESAQDEIRILKQENAAFDNNFRSVVRENDKLRNNVTNLQETIDMQNEMLTKLRREETDKECVMAEQSPEAKVYEDIHTKRMTAEIEAIELDNELKRQSLAKEDEESEWKGKYERENAHFEQLRRHVEEQFHKSRLGLSDSTINLRNTVNSLRTNAIALWVALVAFGVNEVIQWLTR